MVPIDVQWNRNPRSGLRWFAGLRHHLRQRGHGLALGARARAQSSSHALQIFGQALWLVPFWAIGVVLRRHGGNLGRVCDLAVAQECSNGAVADRFKWELRIPSFHIGSVHTVSGRYEIGGAGAPPVWDPCRHKHRSQRVGFSDPAVQGSAVWRGFGDTMNTTSSWMEGNRGSRARRTSRPEEKRRERRVAGYK